MYPRTHTNVPYLLLTFFEQPITLFYCRCCIAYILNIFQIAVNIDNYLKNQRIPFAAKAVHSGLLETYWISSQTKIYVIKTAYNVWKTQVRLDGSIYNIVLEVMYNRLKTTRG